MKKKEKKKENFGRKNTLHFFVTHWKIKTIFVLFTYDLSRKTHVEKMCFEIQY